MVFKGETKFERPEFEHVDNSDPKDAHADRAQFHAMNTWFGSSSSLMSCRKFEFGLDRRDPLNGSAPIPCGIIDVDMFYCQLLSAIVSLACRCAFT